MSIWQSHKNFTSIMYQLSQMQTVPGQNGGKLLQLVLQYVSKTEPVKSPCPRHTLCPVGGGCVAGAAVVVLLVVTGGTGAPVVRLGLAVVGLG